MYVYMNFFFLETSHINTNRIISFFLVTYKYIMYEFILLSHFKNWSCSKILTN